MKTYTNFAPGPRGITLKNGETAWLEPGESVKLDADQVVEPLPDLGTKPAEQPDDTAEIDALKAENADLKKQVEDQGAQITKLTADLEKATAPKK